MKIAIVGASDLSKRIYDVLSEEDDLELVVYQADRIVEMVEKSEGIDEHVDGIIFTGVGVYCLAINTYEYKKPLGYTNRNITSITEAFYHVYKDYEDFSELKLGIDTVDEIDLLDFFKEFEIEIGGYELQEYRYPKKEEDFIKTYMEQYNEGKINCIMTASRHIYEYFKDRDIPVYRLMTSNSEIRSEYEKLKKDIENLSLNDRIAMVQIIEIKKYENCRIDCKGREELEGILEIYAKEIEGMYKKIDDGEYMILSNKRSTLNDENLNSSFNILNKTRELGMELAIGIGEGDTLYQSEDNARNAVRRSKLDKGSSIFYYDGKKVIGPLFEDNQMEYSTRINRESAKLVEEIGISYQYIEKIDSVKRKLGRNEFTSKELADLLLISERTANRLLKKVIETGYGEESGQEVSLGVGRPRRKIRILF